MITDLEQFKRETKGTHHSEKQLDMCLFRLHKVAADLKQTELNKKVLEHKLKLQAGILDLSKTTAALKQEEDSANGGRVRGRRGLT